MSVEELEDLKMVEDLISWGCKPVVEVIEVKELGVLEVSEVV